MNSLPRFAPVRRSLALAVGAGLVASNLLLFAPAAPSAVGAEVLGPIAELTLTASDTTPSQHHTIEVTAIGKNASGQILGDVTLTTSLESDVASDVIDGNTATFRTASVHTITATETQSGVTSTVVINVAPAPQLPAAGAPVRPEGGLLAFLLIATGTAMVVGARSRQV